MLTFSQLGNFGRLGNQLFQIASVIGMAMKNYDKVVFPNWNFEPYFKNSLPNGTLDDCIKIGEPHFNHHLYVLDANKNYDLIGYYQSEKYFEHCKELIKEQFAFKQEFVSQVKQKIGFNEDVKYIAISVRRGDYVGNANYVQINLAYYKQALSMMPDECELIVFSDDIEWCKSNLSFITRSVKFTDHFTEIESMCLLSQCTHFILPNSTFAWWGAWLGEKNESIIVTPNKWFGEAMAHKNETDIIPQRWTKIEVINDNVDFGDYQVDLKDVTFNIPFYYDHEDRRMNLELIICFIQKHFDTNILVYETGESPKIEYMSKFVKYKFVKSVKMHRTKLLNEMAKESQTPIIFNYDTDVLFHPIQILQCINFIRKNEADGAYPYDGRFVRLPRQWFGVVQKNISTIELNKHTPTIEEETTTSYGGAIAWNREKFFEGGGENEKFISYGPEDYERYHRFTTLGYRLKRAKGYLFHINHYIGSNSSTANEAFEANQAEYEKVKNMNVDDLKAYISVMNTPKVEQKSEKRILDADFIYLLNLEKRTDRKEHAINELKNAGIDHYQIVKAIDGKLINTTPPAGMSQGMVGCFESHKLIVKHALENDFKRIIVFEDDVVFMPNFLKYMSKAIEQIPQDWEFAYLGCNEHSGMESFREKLNQYWVIPFSVWGTHAYMVNGKAALQKLWHGMQEMKTQIDMQLTHHILPELNFKFYALYPNNCVSQKLELGGNIQDWNDLDRGTHLKPNEKPKEGKKNTEVEKLEKQWRTHFKHAAFNHSELVHLNEHYKDFIVNGIPLPEDIVQKMGKNAESIIDTFANEINPIWDKLDKYKETGELPAPPPIKLQDLPDDPIKLISMRQNIRTYISKAKKGKKFNKSIQEMEAELLEIEKKLSI